MKSKNLLKPKKIGIAVAFVLCLCNLDVAGQEPVDSMTISKYTETDDISKYTETDDVSKYTESDIILHSDTDAPVNIFLSESLDVYYTHSPAKAAIMSAVLPGLGQIYNKKYWKVPIVYAAVGVSTGIFLKWQNEFSRYRRAYIDINDGDPYTNYHKTLGKKIGLPENYPEEQLRQSITKRKEMLRTWRDYSIVAVVAAYALNILDANVDAHLMDFSLDDNISLNIKPSFLENDIKSKKFALTLQFTF